MIQKELYIIRQRWNKNYTSVKTSITQTSTQIFWDCPYSALIFSESVYQKKQYDKSYDASNLLQRRTPFLFISITFGQL